MLLSTPWTCQPRASKYVTASEPMSPLLPVTITLRVEAVAIVSPSAHQPASSQLALGACELVAYGRRTRPGDDLLEARLPIGGGPKSEQLGRLPGVGIAMPDVTG